MRFWLSRVCHMFIILSMGLVLLAIYIRTHYIGETPYRNSITNLASGAFRLFQLQKNADGSAVILTQAGQPIRLDPESLPKAPFGLEKFDSYRGTLNHYAGVAAEITAYYQARKDALLQATQTIQSDVRFPASIFGATNGDLRIEVPGIASQQLSAKHLDQFTQSAVSALNSGRAWYPSLPSLQEIEPTGSEAVNTGATESIEDQAPTARGRGYDGIPPSCTAAIQNYFSHWASDLAAQLGDTPPVARDNQTVTLRHVLNNQSARLHADLTKVAEGEAGSFWLMGPYRWWEIIFWVWFGVITVSLIQLAPFIRGSKTENRWEARETWVVFAKLFYAPVLALVIFFVLGHLGIGQTELSEFGRGSLVTLGVAFILGAFPHTSWRIIRDLCVRMFRDDLRESPKQHAGPATVTVHSERTPSGTGVIYTVADLKKNAAAHVTAIIKNTERP